jgi:hypothetical protein
MDPIREELLKKVGEAYDQALDAALSRAIGNVERALGTGMPMPSNVIELRPKRTVSQATRAKLSETALLREAKKRGRPSNRARILDLLRGSGGAINMGVLCKRLGADFAATKAALEMLRTEKKVRLVGQGVAMKVIAA